jgi:multisubunit Na+/H+ antiporter MnhF subunit
MSRFDGTKLDRDRLALATASVASGFALAFGAVTGNAAILVVGIVLLVIGPIRTIASSRR